MSVPKRLATLGKGLMRWVGKLKRQQFGQWKEETITRLFNNVEADAILNILLAKHLREDSRVWSEEPTGEYTVRSGYKRPLRGSTNPEIDNSEDTSKEYYNNLWQADLPSKIKITN
ncbi:hypothetical protein J1N35_019557 [Gossypium stocksii]|uniref:Uncharacterized protein n=1 Tax=Gossypium stocksii TaxID=47602 RepID=A0A9D3VT51_9ROSI|nr:hypothetical protein J1N35_019557 [Gossypium stocksii]